MSHNTFNNYLITNLHLMERGFQYSEIENMIIYEKDFYVEKIIEKAQRIVTNG